MLATRFGANRTQITSDRPLSNDVIARYAPSIFAEAPHDSRSDRYAYIPTIRVLDKLRSEGFQPFSVGQSRSRIPGKSEFTKHMVRLRREDKRDEGGVPELILINSHDGTSSYQLLAGYFRFICMNGMVCGEKTDDIRIKHSGDVAGQVIDAAYTVVDRLDGVTDQRKLMQSLPLSPGEQRLLANAALLARYGDEQRPPVLAEQVLQPRRYEDRANDLWTTFNRVQENMVQGGLAGRSANNRRTRTRAITGIDTNVNVNRALWLLATEMAKLKATV